MQKTLKEGVAKPETLSLYQKNGRYLNVKWAGYFERIFPAMRLQSSRPAYSSATLPAAKALLEPSSGRPLVGCVDSLKLGFSAMLSQISETWC